MNNTRRSISEWAECVNIAHEMGLKLVNDCIFKDEHGNHFDLFAADFSQLDRIRREKLFVVKALT